MDNTWTRARVLKTLALIFVLGFCAVVGGFSMALHRNPWQILTLQLTPSPQELFKKDRILVLVEGLDYDYTAKDEEYSTNARSDVIWGLDLDFANKRVYQVQVLRDMVATMPGGREAKINEAQSEGGVREAQAVIAKWLGIPGFDRYMVFRVNTTKDLVNALGGVDVNVMNSDCITTPGHCTDGPLDYDDTWGHLSIHLKPGMQHLNGDQAVGYMRFRHDWCGDPCRAKRQQQVLHALLQKLSHDKFNTLMHANDVIGVVNRDVVTNFTREEELSIAQNLAGMPPDGLKTMTIPYASETVLADGGSAIVPDSNARAKIVHDMLLDPPAPTPPPDMSAVAAVDPKTVTVDVENGTQLGGVAKKMAAVLRREGFTIGNVTNAARSDLATTEVHGAASDTAPAIRVRQALGKEGANATLVADAANGSRVTLIVGQDVAAKLAMQPSAP